MTDGRRLLCGAGWRHDGVVVTILCGCTVFTWAADPPSLRLFDLPRPQLRSFAFALPASASARASDTPESVEDFALQTKAATEVSLLVQRYETMNGRSPLALHPMPPDASRFRRTLDSLLPAKGAFLQKNPNELASPLRMSENWAK